MTTEANTIVRSEPRKDLFQKCSIGDLFAIDEKIDQWNNLNVIMCRKQVTDMNKNHYKMEVSTKLEGDDVHSKGETYARSKRVMNTKSKLFRVYSNYEIEKILNKTFTQSKQFEEKYVKSVEDLEFERVVKEILSNEIYLIADLRNMFDHFKEKEELFEI